MPSHLHEKDVIIDLSSPIRDSVARQACHHGNGWLTVSNSVCFRSADGRSLQGHNAANQL